MNKILIEDSVNCPCGSNSTYIDCCGQYIKLDKIPATPEQLMRSRYTAYTIADIDYVFATMRDNALKDADRKESERWAKSSKWLGLKILEAPEVSIDSNEGTVEFIASYVLDNQTHNLREHSKFKKYDDRWYYTGNVIEQSMPRIETITVGEKIGRNDPCNCGSGKKYKKCCLK